MLRILVFALGLILVVGGVVMAVLLPGGARLVALEPGIGGLVIIAGLVLDRRYRRRVDRSRSTWRATGERFNDPVSGAKTEVFYDPTTGERDYRNVDAP